MAAIYLWDHLNEVIWMLAKMWILSVAEWLCKGFAYLPADITDKSEDVWLMSFI